MHLQLDPAVPLVWRTPTSLQFGVDAPRLVLDQVSVIDEVLLAALRSGAQRPHLQALITGAGGSDEYLSTMLTALEVVLKRSSEPALPVAAASVLIDGAGATAQLLADSLRREGFAVQLTSESALDGIATPPDFVVIVANYAVQPRRYGRWLRTDVPHLPIVFGDGGVRIGPLVQPGSGPCLLCIDLEHTDQDAAWPAVASQLMGYTAPSETPHAAQLAAGIAGGLVTEKLRDIEKLRQAEKLRHGMPGGAALDENSGASLRRWSAASVHIGPDGWVSHDEHSPHQECGCQMG